MKEYFQGYYCRDDLHLQVLNKDSNRRILAALRDVYPNGLSVEELTSKSKLPAKTIYAQKAELYREYFVNHADRDNQKVMTKKGRPLTKSRAHEAFRRRVSIVAEEAYGIFDPFKGLKPTPLPPGNVIYTEGFTEVWRKLVGKDEQEDLYSHLSHYVERMLHRIEEYDAGQGRKGKEKWSPERSSEFCCSQCGLNHEARDFIRAILMHIIDQFQNSSRFIEFLKKNGLISQEAFDQIVKRLDDKPSYL